MRALGLRGVGRLLSIGCTSWGARSVTMDFWVNRGAPRVFFLKIQRAKAGPPIRLALTDQPRGPGSRLELELELIQPHMTQKQMLRGEVDARALREARPPSLTRGSLGRIFSSIYLGCGDSNARLEPASRNLLD